jgi:hypothetical protein
MIGIDAIEVAETIVSARIIGSGTKVSNAGRGGDAKLKK